MHKGDGKLEVDNGHADGEQRHGQSRGYGGEDGERYRDKE